MGHVVGAGVLFFFITLKPRVECYKRLYAFNTSSPRNQALAYGMVNRNADVLRCYNLALEVQGYLAHKKQPPPLGPPSGPGHSPYCRVLGGRCVLRCYTLALEVPPPPPSRESSLLTTYWSESTLSS